MPTSLSNFFFDHTDDAGNSLKLVVNDGKKIPALGQSIDQLRQVKWGPLTSEIGKNLYGALDIGLDRIFVSAWTKYNELQKTLEMSRHVVYGTYHVPLGEHTIKSKHEPRVEILLNEKKVAHLKFALDIALNVRGALLKIEEGKICEILAGDFQGEGELKLGSARLVKKQTPRVRLPRLAKFGTGLDLRLPRTA